jgi:hypothetical protein
VVGNLERVAARVRLLGNRADHGFPIDPEQGQWLRTVALRLLDGIDEAATEGAKAKKPALTYAPGPIDRAIAQVSSEPMPRLP